MMSRRILESHITIYLKNIRNKLNAHHQTPSSRQTPPHLLSNRYMLSWEIGVAESLGVVLLGQGEKNDSKAVS